MNLSAHIPHMPPVPALQGTPTPRSNLSLRRLLPLAIFALGLSSSIAACPTLPAQEQAPAQSPAAAPPAAASTPAAAPNPATVAERPQPGEITEEQLRQLLAGKQLFLRGGYLGDSLSFNEHGEPIGHPAAGSYTLCGVEIEKIHLTKHKVEFIGDRYALHFLGALPSEDPSRAVDRVKITPKKKVLRITIDREQVVKEKKAKEPARDKAQKPAAPAAVSGPATASNPGQPVASSETDVTVAPRSAAPNPAAPAAEPAAESTQTPPAAEDKTDQAADAASVTTTTSPAHAARVLRDAIDKVFATGLDDKIRAQMPEFWQLYYQAQAAGSDYRPKDPAVFRSSAVDRQAKVVTSIAPDSNEFAQASGIAGRALYRAVIGADGKPGEIAVVRPIGFGLDENAVSAIRKATFEPAMKEGKPVAETLDLAVLFRIYSKRTSVAASETRTADPAKPGPYTVRAQQEQPKQPDPAPQ